MAGFGPINGAGTSDMLMRNTNTGAFELYDISNNAITAAEPMGQVGLEWSVAGIAAATSSGSAPANAQLLQAMASYAPSAAPPAANGPIAAATQISPANSAHRRAASVVTNLKRGTLRADGADAARIGSCGAAVVTLFLTFCLVFGYNNLILLIESQGDASRDDP